MNVILEELVSIPADEAHLSGRLTYSQSESPTCSALIMGAHPLLGGNIENNVGTALRLGLAEKNFAVLTFEYRRATAPDGTAIDWTSTLSEFWRTNHVPHEPVWRSDAGAALRYLRNASAGPVVLIGYSFGCWALAELAEPSRAAALICISPNPCDHDLAKLRSATTPLLVVTSDNDFSCPWEKLNAWFESLVGPKMLECLPSAEHFFRGREQEVVQIIADFLRTQNLIED